jgi:hypothetical protein
VPFLALAVLQWVGTLSGPALLDRWPLLVVLMSPRAPFLLYASATSPLGLFLLVASFRLLLADPLNYCIGRRYGAGMTERFARRGRGASLVRLSERCFDRCGLVAVALRPNALMLALAGARRLNPWATGTAAVAGTVAYAVGIAVTADAAADPMGRLVRWAGGTVDPDWFEVTNTEMAVTAAVLVVAAVGGGVLLRSPLRSRLRSARA